MVENIVAIELAYINTKHPDFHKDAALVPSLLKADHIQEPWNRSDGNTHHHHRRHNRNPSPHVANHQNNVDEQSPKTNEVDYASLFSITYMK